MGREQQKRIETEGKAKVVVSVLGAEFVQFLVALAVLLRSIWKQWLSSASLFRKKRLNSTISFKTIETKQLARQGIEQILPPQTDATTFVLHSVSIILLWAAITLKSWPET